WAVLERMSREQWIDEHNIRGRYPEAGDELLAEEGVTSAFGKWLSERAPLKPEVQTIFTKIADFLHRISLMAKEFFGRELTPEEIFERIWTGEVGRREPYGEPMYA